MCYLICNMCSLGSKEMNHRSESGLKTNGYTLSFCVCIAKNVRYVARVMIWCKYVSIIPWFDSLYPDMWVCCLLWFTLKKWFNNLNICKHYSLITIRCINGPLESSHIYWAICFWNLYVGFIHGKRVYMHMCLIEVKYAF